MTKYASLILIISTIIVLNLFFACSKVDDSDHTPPTIEVISPRANDTLYVYRESDTIFSIFEARVTDDTALSSYTFRIQHGKDTLFTESGDTLAYYQRNYQGVSIFDTTQITIAQSFRIDSLMSVTKKGFSQNYKIWEGTYHLHASVVDMQGNVTKFDSIPVFVKYRSSKSEK